jgi:hypothetical protein
MPSKTSRVHKALWNGGGDWIGQGDEGEAERERVLIGAELLTLLSAEWMGSRGVEI